MGAIGLNGAAGTLDDQAQRGRATNAGWMAWAPVNAAAIGAHLLGGALIVRENRSRIAGQKGVAAWTATKTGLTCAALAATAGTGYYGSKVWKEGDVPVRNATTPSSQTPPEAATALPKLKVLQWVVPVLTGLIVASSATMGEQQRPAEVLKGSAKRGAAAARHAARHPQATVKSAAALATH